MSEKMGIPQGEARKPGDVMEQLDNPPLWSPWNFQTEPRDWHEIIYDELYSKYTETKNT
jgi:hypothetical protein